MEYTSRFKHRNLPYRVSAFNKMKIPFTDYHITKLPKKGTNIFNFKDKTEKAFTIKGVDYYQFITLADMPTLRYYQCTQFLTEMDMRVDRETLLEFLKTSMEELDKGNISRSIVLQNALLEQAEMLIEKDTFYRLASCVFFTKDENLEEYDLDLGDKKIEAFLEEGVSGFFLKKPVRTLLPLDSLSQENIALFLQASDARKKFREQLLTKSKSEQSLHITETE